MSPGRPGACSVQAHTTSPGRDGPGHGQGTCEVSPCYKLDTEVQSLEGVPQTVRSRAGLQSRRSDQTPCSPTASALAMCTLPLTVIIGVVCMVQWDPTAFHRKEGGRKPNSERRLTGSLCSRSCRSISHSIAVSPALSQPGRNRFHPRCTSDKTEARGG